jgi:hypothetical protein
MNKYKMRKRTGFIFIIALSVIVSSSCKPSKCVMCEMDNSTIYKVELKQDSRKATDQPINSFFTPILVENSKKSAEIYIINCQLDDQPFLMDVREMEQYIRQNTMRIDTSIIERVIKSSDTDIPPVVATFKSFDVLCDRYRRNLKFEVRGMLGSRHPWHNEGLYYPGVGDESGVLYDKNELINNVIGFGPGGTNLIVGAEAAILPKIISIKNRHSVNLGLLSGYWPVDGAHFIPLSIHPRFTFNDVSSPLWGKCNAWYLYADLGPVLKVGNINTNTTYPSVAEQFEGLLRIPSGGLYSSSWFTGIGFGIDLWKNRGRDLSFDMGYRYSNLILPKNENFENCLEESGKDYDLPYPSRSVGQIIFRIGYTW